MHYVTPPIKKTYLIPIIYPQTKLRKTIGMRYSAKTLDKTDSIPPVVYCTFRYITVLYFTAPW